MPFATIGYDPETKACPNLVAHFPRVPMRDIEGRAALEYARLRHPHAKVSTVNREVIAPIKAVLRASRISTDHIAKWREEPGGGAAYRRLRALALRAWAPCRVSFRASLFRPVRARA